MPASRVTTLASKDDSEALLTVEEASRLLHIHKNTLRRWSDSGLLKAARLGPRGDRRFKREDINAILVERSS